MALFAMAYHVGGMREVGQGGGGDAIGRKGGRSRMRRRKPKV